MAYAESLPQDSASKKFQGVLVDNSGSNEFVACAGVDLATQNAESVGTQLVSVSTVSGAGAVVDTIASDQLPATLGQKAASLSFAVVPTERQFTTALQRIPGDNDSHYLGTAAGATLAATKDTMMSVLQPTYNGGAYDQFVVGSVGVADQARRTLLQFDIETYALITIATAKLRLKTIGAPPNVGSLQAYAIKAANKDWVEGAQTWDTATGTDPNWNKRSVSPDGDWAGSAGLSTADTDYDSTSMGTLSWTADATTWFEMTMTPALVQAMCSKNYGILLIGDTEVAEDVYATFYSNEAASSANRPQLVLTVGANVTKRVLLLADGSGATWVNDTSADTNDAPIPVSGIEIPFDTNGTAGIAVYVPTGVNVWFAGLAYA